MPRPASWTSSCRRDQELSVPIETFQQTYKRIEGHDLTAQTEGYVQDVAERGVLQTLEASIRELLSKLSDGSVLVIESELAEVEGETVIVDRRARREKLNLEDFQAVFAGGIIRF